MLFQRCAERDGYALVFALWIALLVGVTGIVATRLAASGAGAARIEADLARARAAAEGGVWAAAHRLAVQPTAARPPRDAFAFTLNGSEIAVEVADEEGRVDLNAAPESLLADLFRVSGLPDPEAAILAARVVEWRDPANQRRRDEAGRQDGGRGAGSSRLAFRSTGELAAVPGMSRALVEALRGAVTIHTGRARPAEDSAPAPVLAMLRLSQDISPVQSRATGLRTPSAGRGSTAGRRVIWRIESRARSGAVEARVAAVMEIAPGNGMPGRVLEWRIAGF
ncbi:MAG TPA: hypothetical protein VIL69_05645 [Roseomonas sp.]